MTTKLVVCFEVECGCPERNVCPHGRPHIPTMTEEGDPCTYRWGCTRTGRSVDAACYDADTIRWRLEDAAG